VSHKEKNSSLQPNRPYTDMTATAKKYYSNINTEVSSDKTRESGSNESHVIMLNLNPISHFLLLYRSV